MLWKTGDELRSASSERPTRDRTAREVDVAVVGAGLAGCVAAVTLGRAGYSVALIDRLPDCPPQFRVEKFGGEQAEVFERLGLLDAIAAETTRFSDVINLRNGRIIDRTDTPFYAFRYENLVRVVRDQSPASVSFLAAGVTDVQAGPERQRVVLADGGVIEARLVVLATGMSDALWEGLGITRRATFEKHSVTFGFDLAPVEGGRFRRSALTYYGDGPRNHIDYLTLFPLDGVVRANLFTFLDHRDPWLRELRQDPKATLVRTFRGLADFLGDFRLASPVQSWVMTLYAVEGQERDGVALVGDAFRTSCPAAGIGVARLLSDVERLCRIHAPAWLASPGMGREKISAYYRDSEKVSFDALALKLSHGRRSLTVDTSLAWSTRRHVHFLHRRLADRFRAFHSPHANGRDDLAQADQASTAASLGRRRGARGRSAFDTSV